MAVPCRFLGQLKIFVMDVETAKGLANELPWGTTYAPNTAGPLTNACQGDKHVRNAVRFEGDDDNLLCDSLMSSLMSSLMLMMVDRLTG